MYYVLMCITNSHNNGMPLKVSKTKKALVQHLKAEGYYFSKKIGRFIDDRTCKIKGGSGVEYKIWDIDSV